MEREKMTAAAPRDAELGQQLECIIALRTHFTGEPPYVGNQGVALALEEALDERDRYRAVLEQMHKMAWPADKYRALARETLAPKAPTP